MAVMDEFQEERESIKNGTIKQKIRYFRDYYLGGTIIGLIVAGIVISFIYQIVTAKDSVLTVSFLNCASYGEDNDIQQEFMEYIGQDPKKYCVTLDTNNYFSVNGTDQSSYTTIQKITTYIGAGALDAIVGGGEEFQYYANTILFCDLRDVMSGEQIEKYEPYFYYVDMAIILEEDGTSKAPEDIRNAGIPDPRKPEDMERPVPVALYMDNSTILSDNFLISHADEGIAFAICANSSKKETTLRFIDYLLGN